MGGLWGVGLKLYGVSQDLRLCLPPRPQRSATLRDPQRRTTLRDLQSTTSPREPLPAPAGVIGPATTDLTGAPAVGPGATLTSKEGDQNSNAASRDYQWLI
uniref:Uncharacterized protein n=1 Tax=Eutreptiella gymnastica TaxID=73025 RepID=A0A7S4G3K2_9EUGL